MLTSKSNIISTGNALPTSAFTTWRQWLLSRRLNSGGRVPLQRKQPKLLLSHARREAVANTLDHGLFDDSYVKHLHAKCGIIHSRRLFGTTSVSWTSSGGSRREHTTDTNRDSSNFVHVNDKSNHWLPCLAANAAQQEHGHLLSRVFGATKGDYTSADISRLQQKATDATTRSGWKIPPVAVVLFHAEWSASSADFQRWLTNALASKAQDKARLELILVSSETSPLLTKVYNVTSIPHCVLLLKGCVALELPAAASDARCAAFAAKVEEAVSSNGVDASPRGGRDASIINQLEEALKTTAPRNREKIIELMQMLLSTSVPYVARPVPSHAALGQRVKESQLLSGISNKSIDEKTNEPLGIHLFDGDERASRLAARGTVALFDVPGVATEDLKALEEALVLRLGSYPRGYSAKEKLSRESAQLPERLHAILLKIVECEEPQWSIDDCTTIRCLPLFNQLTLNSNLFSKARGAQPPRRSKEEMSSDAAESVQIPQWQLSAWLARTRRCLSARMFLESAEDAALNLAAKSHKEWLEASSASNCMRLRLERREACEVVGGSEAFETTREEVGNNGEKNRRADVVHPLDVFSEPRAPSPGRALLSSMYAALGPEDSRVYQNFANLQVAVKAADFHPTKFSHTRARRGGKPRMMRGRSGRWFWLGPYWKPPWAPKKHPLVESWHLTNATA